MHGNGSLPYGLLVHRNVTAKTPEKKMRPF